MGETLLTILKSLTSPKVALVVSISSFFLLVLLIIWASFLNIEAFTQLNTSSFIDLAIQFVQIVETDGNAEIKTSFATLLVIWVTSTNFFFISCICQVLGCFFSYVKRKKYIRKFKRCSLRLFIEDRNEAIDYRDQIHAEVDNVIEARTRLLGLSDGYKDFLKLFEGGRVALVPDSFEDKIIMNDLEQLEIIERVLSSEESYQFQLTSKYASSVRQYASHKLTVYLFVNFLKALLCETEVIAYSTLCKNYSLCFDLFIPLLFLTTIASIASVLRFPVLILERIAFRTG